MIDSKVLINNHLNTRINMKKLKLFGIIILFLISCSPLKKSAVTRNSNPVIDIPNNSQLKDSTFSSVSNPVFDLSFINKVDKSYVDSLGNLFIADSILEKRLKSFLMLKQNDLIKLSMVDTITILNFNNIESATPDNQKISNIDALSYFRSLRILSIENNLVRNIQPVVTLSNLEELNISRNLITNISMIKDLNKLKKLNLYGNRVSNISSLSGLLELTDLNLWGNGVFKIESLKDLVKISYLNLGGNYIRDISPLNKMTKLNNLWLHGNLITNPEIIAGFGNNLITLSISKCGISDIHFLENCTQLKELVMFDNKIKDISPIYKMKNLNTFIARNNQIENIDVLADLVKDGALRARGKYGNSLNIDLQNNLIDYQTPNNMKIRNYLIDNVFKVEF